MKNIHYKSIREVSSLIRERKISPVDVVETCLARIEELNPTINAFITVLADEARQQARQAEEEIKAGNYRGPLHGIPVALKDMFDTAGIKTTAAFQYFKDRVPKNDAAVVKKLKEAGAIIVGKTNMHELAMGTTSQASYFGPVLNPWNTEYIPGGSSGGSAAAVASGICFATIDTDAIGSTRLPAACCGVVGYKCTWGQIDNSGILEGERTDELILKLATIGITTRDVEDTALVADALTGGSFAEATKEKNTKLRVGRVMNFGATAGIREVFDKAVEDMKKLGFTTTEVMAPFDENPDMSAIDTSRKNVNETLFKNADVLVLPTTAAEVPKAEEVGDNPQALSPQNTFFVNYLGLPAISIPCGFDMHGMPVGLQIVGKHGEDTTVLQVAHTYAASEYTRIRQHPVH